MQKFLKRGLGRDFFQEVPPQFLPPVLLYSGFRLVFGGWA